MLKPLEWIGQPSFCMDFLLSNILRRLWIVLKLTPGPCLTYLLELEWNTDEEISSSSDRLSRLLSEKQELSCNLRKK